MARLSTDLRDGRARPYFLWDEDITIDEFRQRLSTGSTAERRRLLAKLLREARDDHVWIFCTPREIAAELDSLEPQLGRRASFWRYLIKAWQKHGLL